MNFLSRKVRTQEMERIEDHVIHREIEITVQREWVSVTGGVRSMKSHEVPLAPASQTDNQLQDARLHDERKSQL